MKRSNQKFYNQQTLDIKKSKTVYTRNGNPYVRNRIDDNDIHTMFQREKKIIIYRTLHSSITKPKILEWLFFCSNEKGKKNVKKKADK